MQAKLVDQLPVGQQWRYELKLDGYRALAIKTTAGVNLISRNENDLSSDYPEIVESVRLLPLRQGMLDGEIVVVDEAGRPSFQLLQHLGSPGRKSRPIVYFAFDLLNLDGRSLLSLPLTERKRLLEGLLRTASSQIRFVPFLEGDAGTVLKAIRGTGLEGIVAKLATSRYEPGKRSGAWSKFKTGHEQEFVIGGYTRGRGGRSEFGALIVGYYEQGQLRYASKVGTGFSNRQIREFVAGTEPLRQAQCPFVHLPRKRGQLLELRPNRDRAEDGRLAQARAGLPRAFHRVDS
jgi:bifunctional non-homologous end joining protein LigD